jgi:uncharacterized protein (TIGR00266 family)
LEYTIQSQPSYSLLEVTLDENDSLAAESGAMAWMSDNIRMTTSTRGGVLTGIRRSVLGGESFFQNTYRAEGGNGVIGLAPGQSGNIVAHDMDRDELFLEKNAYLASTPDIHTDSNFQGLRGLFNEGLFVLTVGGTGTLFFNGYGDVERIDVDGSYVIDNGHAVAWEPSLSYHLTKARRIRSFLFSDQVLMRFEGRGRLWVQSRNPRTLADWVYPFRPEASKGSDD